jgi:TonB family protein
MRRHVLHIAAALLTFTVGFVTADSYENLGYALPLSLLAFLLTKALPRVELDLHFLTVVVMSLLLWAAGVAAALDILSLEGGSCVIEFSGEGDRESLESNVDAQPPPTNRPFAEITGHPCQSTDVSPTLVNSVWAGVVDRKAVAKPAPHYPPVAKAARAEGAVAVWVLADESGRVVWSKSISGHPLLQRSAMEAACSARFSPILVDSSPIRASGILTYKFMLWPRRVWGTHTLLRESDFAHEVCEARAVSSSSCIR